MIDYLVLPTPADIRGVRGYLDWKQMDLAYRCEVNIATITAIEKEKSKPSKELLETIARVFMTEGAYFLPGGGFKIDKNIVTIYEGKDCYLKLQDDILKTCAPDKKEVLYLGGDDSKSSPKIIEKEKEIYSAGIPCKNLIEEGNDFIVGPRESYRKIDKDYFLCDDVVVIYGDKVSMSATILEKGSIERIIVINDSGISDRYKRYFYRLWGKAIKIEYAFYLDQKYFNKVISDIINSSIRKSV